MTAKKLLKAILGMRRKKLEKVALGMTAYQKCFEQPSE